MVQLKWEECASLPHPRKHLQTVQVDHKLYVGSGYGETKDISSMLYCLDLNSENWVDCPKSLTLQFAMAKFDGKIILIGGNKNVTGQLAQDVRCSVQNEVSTEVHIAEDSLPISSSDVVETGQIQYLSEDGSEWKFFTDEEMPPMKTPRLGAVAIALGCDLVVAGGYGKGKTRLRVVEVYNKPSKRWYTAMDLPYDVAELKTALCHGNEWYLLGGAGNERNAAVFISLKEMIKKCVRPVISIGNEVDPQLEGGWTTMPNLPHAFSAAANFGGCLVALGGEREGFFSSTYRDVYVYDPHGNQWVRVAEMPKALSKCAAISLSSGCLYVMGGYSKNRKSGNAFFKCSLVTREEEDSQNVLDD